MESFLLPRIHTAWGRSVEKLPRLLQEAIGKLECIARGITSRSAYQLHRKVRWLQMHWESWKQVDIGFLLSPVDWYSTEVEIQGLWSILIAMNLFHPIRIVFLNWTWTYSKLSWSSSLKVTSHAWCLFLRGALPWLRMQSKELSCLHLQVDRIVDLLNSLPLLALVLQNRSIIPHDES